MLRELRLEHRVLLTGTPLQNNLDELWSLLNFLQPERFPSRDAFISQFGDLKNEDDVSKLQAVLKPLMLRRLKDDVVRRGSSSPGSRASRHCFKPLTCADSAPVPEQRDALPFDRLVSPHASLWPGVGYRKRTFQPRKRPSLKWR